MAKGQDIRIGPWPDGINLLDLPDQIQDSQLSSCTNFDIDNTGVLTPRRAISTVKDYENGGTALYYLMGSVVLVGETQPRAVISRYNAVGNSDFFFKRRPDITDQIAGRAALAGYFKSCVQYNSKIWYIPGNAGSVGAWSTADPATLTATTNVATMPWGDYGFMLKDRLFIVRKSTSELYFSTPTALEPSGIFTAPWSGTAPNSGGVIQVNPGDNQPITKVVVVNNQIIIFKRDSTYIFSYTSSPTADGVLRQISPDQGAIDAITYNNEVYCYNARSVFKFVNGYFQDIGSQLNLANNEDIDSYTGTTPARINVVGKTLVLGKFASTDNMYAMNLDTGAWSKYSHSSNNQSISSGTVISRSIIGTAVFFGDGTSHLWHMLVSGTRYVDLVEYGDYMIPGYEFRTKFFDFDDSETWKRLYSWHLDSSGPTTADARATTFVNGNLNAVTNSDDVTDLIGPGAVGSSVSVRFKTLAFGRRSFSNVSAAGFIPGPIIRGVRAVIGAKAPISV